MLFSVLNEFNEMNVRMRKACEDVGKCLYASHDCLNWCRDIFSGHGCVDAFLKSRDKHVLGHGCVSRHV